MLFSLPVHLSLSNWIFFSLEVLFVTTHRAVGGFPDAEDVALFASVWSQPICVGFGEVAPTAQLHHRVQSFARYEADLEHIFRCDSDPL